MLELNELKELLEENDIDLSDLDDILSTAFCSSCCSSGGGGVSN